MKSFEVPSFYRSELISSIKKERKEKDKLKKDFSPTILPYENVEFYLARHFGFCYGVENAIEIAFKTVQENPDKRIFLLSEMIHNAQVNNDLQQLGVQFLMDTNGNKLNTWNTLTKEDIVIIPAFGTTLAIEEELRIIGIDALKYNTTCPFVEKVWNRSEVIGKQGYTIIIHGKPKHEETRATFSHSSYNAPSVVVKDIEDAKKLSQYILNKKPQQEFYNEFEGKYSKDFDIKKDLEKIGVVNQTTMLASETQEIAEYLKKCILEKQNALHENIQNKDYFADTRDTLCYATLDNQTSVKAMLEVEADLAIVIGGYNSSNTSHLVELCEQKLNTYYIENEENIISSKEISHYIFQKKEHKTTSGFLPINKVPKILITSGASCPDAIVERVIDKLRKTIM